MKAYPTENSTLIVIKKGEELIETLNAYAIEHSLQGGWVTIIGGAARVTLGFFNSKNRDYTWQTFEEQLEITGLYGNLAYVDGKPFWHIHGMFSREDFSVIGGHVKECTIGLTGEVHLVHHDVQLTRVFDDETGLKLLTREN
ncbi:MAG: PPC domain-containing DNA-binding protein [Candidatus Microsaccharimonas sp.]